MNRVKDIVSESKYPIKCTYFMEPEFIVIHNTANDASAKNEVSYMKNNNSSVSYHFAVDDIEIRQALPINRNGWHAGDGTKGNGNRKGIAIEVCYSKSGGERFAKAEENAAILAAELLDQYGWGIDRLKKHQDFSGKYCPHRTLDMGWDRFVKMVEKNMKYEPTIENVVEELYNKGILTAKDYWITRLKEDNNVFCLVRNCLNYIKKGD